MTAGDRPFDVALQPERTLLAWRRTTLSLAVANAVAVRLTIGELGVAAVVVGMLGVTLSAFAYLAAGARYRRVHESLVKNQRLPATGGWPFLAVALTMVVLGLVGMAYLFGAGGRSG